MKGGNYYRLIPGVGGGQHEPNFTVALILHTDSYFKTFFFSKLELSTIYLKFHKTLLETCGKMSTVACFLHVAWVNRGFDLID